MPFHWREYLDLARALQLNPPASNSAESVARCGVSRAYYAAFCYARNYARDYLGFVPRNDGDDHGRLRAHLRQRRRHRTSDSLDRLRQWRNDCDYLDDLPGGVTSVPALLAGALAEADYVFASLLPPAP